MPVTYEDLDRGGAPMSQTIIEAYTGDPTFEAVSKRKFDELNARDAEDGVKLQAGIQLAIDKKVLPAEVAVEPTIKVDATGKNPELVAKEIIKLLGDAPSKGCVMTLQGLSGTGKGTTVAKLQELLPNAITWSNGNIFRSLTLLAKTDAEQKGVPLEEVLTAELLGTYLAMLTFDKFDGKFDTKIEGLGLSYMVSDVQNTVLKTVSSVVPTVANVTQGEVILFIQGALAKMAAAGVNVLLEGREQTLNYIRTPFRFELTLADPLVTGKRQAALMMGAAAKAKVDTSGVKDDTAVKAALDEVMATLPK